MAPVRRRIADDDEPRPRRRVADDDDVPTRRRRLDPEPVTEEADVEDVEMAPRRRRRSDPEDSAPPDEQPRTHRRGPGPRRAPVGGAGRAPVDRGGQRRGYQHHVASGWGAFERSRAASSDFEKKFKPSSELQVVTLLETGPFISFGRHWVELEEGKRAFVCPDSVQYVDEDGNPVDVDPQCPLCDIGHKMNAPKAYLNVAVLKPGKPELAVWEIGPQVSEQLQMIDKSIGRRTPITDIYILATATGSGLNTKYHLEPLFEDDLRDLARDEDLPLKPLTDKERDSFELYDESLYPIPSLTELDRIADEIA